MTLPDYCTYTEILDAMPDTNYGAAYYALLTTCAGRASREFDSLTNRDSGAYAVSTDTTRYYHGSGGCQQWIDEIAAAPTTVEVDETNSGTYVAWASTDYYCWPYNKFPACRLDVDTRSTGTKVAWYAFPKGVKITGKFGYSTTVPEVVKTAVIMMAARLFKRGGQAFQDTSTIAELGQLRYVRGVDPQVDETIRRLRRVTT